MKKYFKTYTKKSLALFMTVMMLMSCWVFVAPEHNHASAINYATNDDNQVTGYVTVDPVIYVHGTHSTDEYSYMMNGDTVADGTYAGEFHTNVAISGKTLSSITVVDTGSSLSWGNKSVWQSETNSTSAETVLSGSLGGGYGSITTDTTDSTATLKFTFSDGTYELHTLAVKANPVAQHAMAYAANWYTGAFGSGKKVAVSQFEVLAMGSYGQASFGSFETNRGNPSYGKDTVINWPSMYDPFNSTASVADKAAVNGTLQKGANSGTVDKYAGNFGSGIYGGNLASTKNDNYSYVTSATSNYFLDLSSNINSGIVHSSGTNLWTIKMLVGNVKNTDFNNDHNLCSGFPTATHTLSATPDIITTLSGSTSEVGYLTISGTATAPSTVSGNFVISYTNTNKMTVTTKITMPYQITVVDKSALRNVYNKYINEKLTGAPYTAETWSAYSNALLDAESYLNNYQADTSTEATLKTTLETAYKNLKKKEYTISLTLTKGTVTLDTVTKTVEYGDSYTYTYAKDQNGFIIDTNTHSAFEGWKDTSGNVAYTNSTLSFTNITENKTYTGSYGADESHNTSNLTSDAANGTHQTTCSVCGNKNAAIKCNFTNWKEVNGQHVGYCSATGCTNTSTHSANWTEETLDKYIVEADKNLNNCEKGIRYYKHCADCDIISTKTFVGKSATGHSYVRNEDKDIAHTCTTNGKWGYVCQNCGDVKQSEYVLDSKGNSTGELADKAAHSLTFGATVSPTCTDKGYDLYKCQNCDYTEKRNKVDANGHSWGTELKEIDKDYHGYYCTVCKTVYNDETKSEHSWGETKVDKKPTCVTTGSGTQTCSDCGATKTVTIAVDKENGHSYSEKPVSDGKGKHSFNCINEGCGKAIEKDCERNDKCQCSDCGYQFAHQYTDTTVNDSTKATDATCTESATYYYSCSVCGDIEKNTKHTFESGEALGHDWEDTTDETYIKDKATCESDEVYYQKCSRCSVKDAKHTYIATGTAKGHDFSGEVVNNNNGTHSYKCKNAGCTATGVGTEKNAYVECTYGAYEQVNGTNHKHTCNDCGYVEEKTHDFTNWTHVESEDKHTRKCNDCSYTEKENCDLKETNYDATCEAPAKVGKECKTCGNNYLADVEGSTALGHAWGEWVSNGDGTHTKTCSRDASHTETQNCSGGTATCTDKKTCEVCHERYGEALGHEMTYNKKVDATCENAGTLENYYCSHCEKYFADENGETELESIVITKLEHLYTGEVKSNGDGTHSLKCVNGCGKYGEAVTCSGGEATCTNKAVCSVCHEEYGEALGHEMTHNEKVDATCENAGTLENYYCSRCKKYFADENGETKLESIVITKLEHSYTGEVKSNGGGTHSLKCVNGCGQYGATEDCSGGTAYCDEEAVCGICNEHYGAKDPDRHKSNTHFDGLAATCMQKGYTAYDQCDKCDKIISGKEPIAIDPTNHNFVGATAQKGENHKHTVQCQNKDADGNQCNVKQEFDCSLSANAVVTAPTCTAGGYTTYTCTVCGNEWTADETPANGHTWSDWKFDKDSAEKVHYKECTVEGCGVRNTATGSCEENETTSTVEATCTEQGYTLHTCNVCGRTWKTDETGEAKHKYDKKTINDEHKVDGDTFASSCTQEQYYWYDCSVCGKNAKDEKDNTTYPENTLYYQNGTAKGHTWEGKTVKADTVLASKATCTENAFYYVYCTKCGLSTNQLDESDEFYNATFEDFGSSRGYHDYQNIVDEDNLEKNRVSEANCSAKAVYYKSCNDCGAVSHETFEYGDYGTHSFTKEVKDAAHRISVANCMTAATYWKSCEHCDLNAKLFDKSGMADDAIAALKFTVGTPDSSNHIALVDVSAVEATCSSAGHSAYQNCSACGTNEIGKTVYAQKDHDFSGACTPARDTDGNVISGKHSIACKYGCDEVKVVDCEFGQWKQDENTMTHTKTCACGASQTAGCVSSGAATCDKAETCVDCGRVIKAALNHKWGAWQSNGDGTHTRICENDASHTETQNCYGGDKNGCGAIICDGCHANYATGTTHAWGKWVDVKTATCTTKATHKRQCSVCFTWSEEVEYGSVKGHDWDSGTENTPATCTTAGEMLYKCKNGCGETKTEVINSLGHEYDAQWTVIEDATCKDEGKKVKYCTHSWVIDGKTIKCDSVKEMTIPADKTKHVESDWIVDETTGSCATGLTKKKVCTVCGVKLDEKTEPIAHDWERAHVTKGTCTANGYINMVCKNCQAEEVFDDTCVGFPYKFDGVAIETDIAESLLSKGGHAWRTEALEGEENYTVIDGKIVYIDKDSTCSQTGRGKMHCANCGEVSDTVTIAKKEHKLKDMPASPATCQTPGYEAYQACENCPYTTTQVRIEALGHEDLNGNGKCDRCGFEMYQTPGGGTNACACICHKNSFFISKIIYPIARFFWKIFKINHSCSCGKTHY